MEVKEFDVVDIDIHFRSISPSHVQTLGSVGAAASELAGTQHFSEGLKRDA